MIAACGGSAQADHVRVRHGHGLAIALNLARLYEEVLQEPLPPELRRLVTRLEVAAGSHQSAEARSTRREAERAAVGSGFGTRRR